MRWALPVITLELKKTLAYRVDFWIQFLLSTSIELTVAYFIWKAVFAVREVETLQGYTLNGLLLYYFFAIFAGRIVRGKEGGYLAGEIYDGSLTRYLLYPLSFLIYKYITHWAHELVQLIQFIFAFLIFQWWVGMPEGTAISPLNILFGTLTCFMAGYLFYVVEGTLEMVAFWQDVIWNLQVMLRFTITLLGGALIPLSFFPQWELRIIELTPFPSMVSFPIKTFLGQITLQEWFFHSAVLVCWSLFFTFLLHFVWKRGTRQYSGVGI